MIENNISKETIELIKKYNFYFQKKFGQNFLIDAHVLNKIIKSADIDKDDLIIEIGPGLGTLTKRLAKEAKKVVAIEIDKKLIPILEEIFVDFKNIELINEDVLKVDFNEVLKNKNEYKSVKIVANLPYYITTPIIMKIFEENVLVDTLTIMIQKEVASRILASPSTKDYGALSLGVKYYSDCELIANVPANCFMPRPNVNSAVIKLTKKEKEYKDIDELFLFKLIRASFMQRRKTLQNSILNSKELNIKKEDIISVLKELSISENIRGEALSLSDFVEITKKLSKKRSLK